MKALRGVISEKENLSLKVARIALTCLSLEELASRLQNEGLEPYYRGSKFTGLWLGNRKFRLTTLGVGKEHLKTLTREQERLDTLHQNRNHHSRGGELER